MIKNITPKNNLNFSKIEIEHLLKAWIAISAVFAIIITRSFSPFDFIIKLGYAAITAGSAFIVHELAHKFVAQKYHCKAEFRANFQMLGVMLLLGILFRVIFAAPGGVVIDGYMTRKQYGKISLAGPLSNVVLALICAGVLMISQGSFLGILAGYAFQINSWLAMFNMLPFGQFDGSKVFHWNKGVYFSVLILCFFLMGLTSYI